MTTTKSSHRPPDKRLGNSQTTNLLRATARYFHHILIIGAIRKIVRGGGGGVRVRDGSNHLNSTRTTDVCGTNLKCFSDFCLFFIIIILMTKVMTKKKSTSTKEFAITYVFLQQINYVTDHVVLQRNIWAISYQHEKVPMLWCSAVPEVTKLKQD